MGWGQSSHLSITVMSLDFLLKCEGPFQVLNIQIQEKIEPVKETELLSWSAEVLQIGIMLWLKVKKSFSRCGVSHLRFHRLGQNVLWYRADGRSLPQAQELVADFRLMLLVKPDRLVDVIA